VDKKDGNRPGKLTKKGVSSVNRRVAVFAFFLLLSFLFWYLNSLGKDQEVSIRYPLRYVNLPEGRQFAGQPPARISLNLKGPGYSILRLKYSGNRAPAVIDLSKVSYRRKPGGNANDYYFLMAGLIEELNTQLKSECKITSVKPDTLYFSFAQTTR